MLSSKIMPIETFLEVQWGLGSMLVREPILYNLQCGKKKERLCLYISGYFLTSFKIIFDLRKSCKNGPEFLHTLYPASPNVSTLYNLSKTIKTKKNHISTMLLTKRQTELLEISPGFLRWCPFSVLGSHLSPRL